MGAAESGGPLNLYSARFRTSFSRQMRLSLVVGGAMLCLAGCGGGATPTTFDLTAANPGKVATGRGYLVVAEPQTVQALDSDRIIVRDSSGAISFLGGAQWAERVPRLIQTRLIQTFENAGRLGRVGRAGDRIIADIQLNTDIRAFTIDASTGEAVVEITAKLVNDRTGRVLAASAFSSRLATSAIDGASGAVALNGALGSVLTDIVRWAARS